MNTHFSIRTMKKILFIFGTRPEAIKLAPLILELRRFPDLFDVRVCVTGQHRQLLDQALRFFEIRPDYDLDIMKPKQSLFDVTTDSLSGLRHVIKSAAPSWIIVQGDTTTVFTAALAGYYSRVKIAHVEAGLRSFDRFSPFPEEVNRILTSHLADLHFAPTASARANLIKEGISEQDIHVVGNTVIDALLLGVDKVKNRTAKEFGTAFETIPERDFSKRIVLVTGHRRESFGKPFENICRALKQIADSGNTVVIYPVHLNPNVRKPVFDILRLVDNV